MIGAIQLIGFGIDLLRKKFNLDTTSKEQAAEIVNVVNKTKERSEYPDFDFYQEMKKISLVTFTESGVDKNRKAIGRSYRKIIKSGGGVLNAYLFVNVSVDDGKPLKVWDSIYVSLRKELNSYLRQPLDGHLLRSESLNVPENDTTTLLYDLRQIPFISIPYSDDKEPIYKDWLTLIQSADTFQFEAFLSTLRKDGKIIDISIGYKCEEDTPNCKLEALNKL